MLIGFAVFYMLLLSSRSWLSTHRQGPFEYLWKKMTWLGSKYQK
ncbi:MAG: DUF418 domain-containing protein [Bacteroidaceae bacterium]|nr:DUF418 domain-containing protein [Bacteroidaceae bacterium]